MFPREKGFVLWGHCPNLLDDPRMSSCITPFFLVVILNFFQNGNSFHYTADSVCVLFVLLLLIHFEHGYR